MIKYKKIIYGSIVASSFLLVFLIDLIQDKASPEPSLNIANQSFSSNKVDVNLVTPDNWQKIEPKSSMRDSEYVIRNSKGEFNLIVFKNIGGSVDQMSKFHSQHNLVLGRSFNSHSEASCKALMLPNFPDIPLFK